MNKNLVFLPSLLCTADMFDFHAQRLKTRYPDINVHSFTFIEEKNITQAAQKVIKECQEPFYLVGISLGGYIAMHILRNYPNLVRGACFFNTFWDIDTPAKQQERNEAIKNAQKVKDEQFHGVNANILETYLYNVTEPKVNLIKNMAQKVGRQGFINHQQIALSRESSVEDFSNYKVPILCVSGDKDVLSPPKIMQTMSKAAKGNFIEIANCGHLSLIDQKEATLAVLDYWLQI